MTQAQTVDVNLGEMLRMVAREKEIEYERLVAALEDSMASAAKKQHRIKEPVRARFDPDTGTFEAWSVRTVVEEVEDPTAEWTVEEAREVKPDAEVGDEITSPVSTEGLGRIAAQSAKQVLYQRVRETEREKVYNEFIDRVGEIVNGTVKRFERGEVVVDLGRTEAVVPRPEQARHERWGQGERIRAVIVDVHKQPKGQQIVLSRTDPRLLVKLFEMEVPEIYDGTVVIKAAVRAPGERAKVAVYSRERDVDPVGACVGMKGSRVQAIIRELRGEKIDIIEYSDDLVTFAQSALAPAKITRVSVHHGGEHPHLDVIVEDEQLSLAIGKRGQNVRLAAELIGCRIDIKSETDVKDEVADALARMLHTALGEDGGAEAGTAIADREVDLTEVPGVGEKTAQDLREAGFGSLVALLSATPESLTAVEGVGPKTAEAILSWAGEQAAAAPPPAEEEIEAAPQQDEFLAALSRAFKESEDMAREAERVAAESEAERVAAESEAERVAAESEAESAAEPEPIQEEATDAGAEPAKTDPTAV